MLILVEETLAEMAMAVINHDHISMSLYLTQTVGKLEFPRFLMNNGGRQAASVVENQLGGGRG